MSEPRTIAFVFARGGSKGLPRKNVLSLAGKPLIAHAIELGLHSPGVETVIVSTDDAEIAAAARNHGAEVPFMRPPELATDNAPEWSAWQHAIRWVQQERGPFDVFLSLPATAPFRQPDDVASCLAALRSDPEADMAITVTEAHRSPWFNMIRHDGDGYARLVNAPEAGISRRQDAPKVYDMTTVAYAGRPGFILRARGLFEGKVRAVTVPVERSLDIDTPFDFQVAQAIASLPKR